MTARLAAAHDLGPVSDIPPGEGRAYDVAGRQIAVFRLRTGALHAVDAVCPHRGGPLADGQTDGRVVLCPLHLTAFDLATGCATGSTYALATYPVRVDESGHVILALASA